MKRPWSGLGSCRRRQEEQEEQAGGGVEEGEGVGGCGEEDWKGDRDDEIDTEEEEEKTGIDAMTSPAEVCSASWN